MTLLSGCASLPNSAVDKVGDRNVEFAMTRHGTLPVIFENGLGGRMEWWKKVLPAISNDTTTFAYNRPGYGNSDLVATPRDGLHIVDELRALLRTKGLKPPYVLVGHSMGGFGSWSIAMNHPGIFAAIGPVAGGGNPAQMDRIRHIPQIVVHGDNDRTVDVSQSRNMVEAAKKLGVHVKYIEVPGGGHNEVFMPAMPQVFEFFAAHP